MKKIKRCNSKKILQLLDEFPAVVLSGPRQVGKTTLANIVAGYCEKFFIYIDLESPQDMQKLEEPELYLDTHSENLVIIDEVQRKPDLFPVLRSVIDRDRKPGRFLLLGSAGPELLKNTSESLAGRVYYTELFPFNILEVSDDRLLWFRGGFPEAYLANTQTAARRWLESFLLTFLERDIPNLGIRIPSLQLRQFWEMTAHAHGQLWNGSKLAANFGVSSHTIKRYLGILENTYMVRQLTPYYTNIKKRIVKTPKVYIRDTGILHTLLQISSQEDLAGHPTIGSSYEGWVIEQICSCLSHSFVKACFYRTQSGAEIDLLLEKGPDRIAIEIKRSLTPKPSRGFKQAVSDLSCNHQFIVYPGTETYPLSSTVKAISLPGLLEFLIVLFDVQYD